MKVIIAGSRNWKNAALIAETMAKFPHPITEIVSGAAAGADYLGEKWAAENKHPIKLFPADWASFGTRAGPLRNGAMARYADALVAFRSYGSSKGTDDMVSQARRNNLLVWVVGPTGAVQVFSSQGELFPPSAK